MKTIPFGNDFYLRLRLVDTTTSGDAREMNLQGDDADYVVDAVTLIGLIGLRGPRRNAAEIKAVTEDGVICRVNGLRMGEYDVEMTGHRELSGDAWRAVKRCSIEIVYSKVEEGNETQYEDGTPVIDMELHVEVLGVGDRIMQADWTIEDETRPDFIKNKPDLSKKADKSDTYTKQAVNSMLTQLRTLVNGETDTKIAALGTVMHYCGNLDFFESTERSALYTAKKGAVFNVPFPFTYNGVTYPMDTFIMVKSDSNNPSWFSERVHVFAPDLSGKADKSQVYTKLQTDQLVQGATDAVRDDLRDELSSRLNEKADKSSTYTKNEVNTALAGKVDKESGKGLSEENYSSTEKAKLGALPTKSELDAELESKVQAAIDVSKAMRVVYSVDWEHPDPENEHIYPATVDKTAAEIFAFHAAGGEVYAVDADGGGYILTPFLVQETEVVFQSIADDGVILQIDIPDQGETLYVERAEIPDRLDGIEAAVSPALTTPSVEGNTLSFVTVGGGKASVKLPTPPAQQQADWDEKNSQSPAYVANRPKVPLTDDAMSMSADGNYSPGMEDGTHFSPNSDNIFNYAILHGAEPLGVRLPGGEWHELGEYVNGWKHIYFYETGGIVVTVSQESDRIYWNVNSADTPNTIEVRLEGGVPLSTESLAAAFDGKVNVKEGYGLSKNDYTNKDKEKVDSLDEIFAAARRQIYIDADFRADTDPNKLRYNAETGFYEMNGISDLTEDDMWKIYKVGEPPYQAERFLNKAIFGGGVDMRVRTTFPTMRVNFQSTVRYGENQTLLEVLCLNPTGSFVIALSSGTPLLVNAAVLHTIIGKIDCVAVVAGAELFRNCPMLKNVTIGRVNKNITVTAPKMSYDSMAYMVAQATNTTAITIKVAPETYSYLTGTATPPEDVGGTSEQWQELAATATNKQIAFAV